MWVSDMPPDVANWPQCLLYDDAVRPIETKPLGAFAPLLVACA